MPLTGRHFGAYEVRALLGAGGMGEVYQADSEPVGITIVLNWQPAGH